MRFALIALAFLTACNDTSMSTSIHAGSGGVTVRPTVSGSAGSATATIRP